MQNTRRIARELALKTLFQVDVGKQPLREVLEGANEQARSAVIGPVNQVVVEAQRELRGLAARQSAELAEHASMHSTRQVKTTATQLGGEVRSLAEAVGTVAAALTRAPDLPLQEVEGQIDGAADQARQNVRRLAAKKSTHPEVLRELAGVAETRIDQIVATARKALPDVAEIAQFMHALVHGVTERASEIDGRLTSLSPDWALDRQAAVDRNILRVAAYELLYMPDVPAGATINEAVELAKKYSTAESGRFVNGVLGALVDDKMKR